MQNGIPNRVPRGAKIAIALCVGAIFTVSTTLVSGCSKFQRDPSKAGTFAGTFEGPATAIGQGTARVFATLDAAGEPTAIGIKLDQAALASLPPDPPPDAEGWEYLLTLPAEAKAAGYNHAAINWNPIGHVPAGIYDVPHFDFHFYLITLEARNGITAVGDDIARIDKAPPEEFMPEGYILPPGTEVPRMGGHAVDPASPEFNHQPFTKTFIYGFYDGHLIFVEPMITMTYLESKPNVTEPVKIPKAYEQHAYYPTQYSVKYDAGRRQYAITLENLVSR